MRPHTAVVQVPMTTEPAHSVTAFAAPAREIDRARPLAWPISQNVHLWCFDLSLPSPDAEGILDADEQDHAARFVFAHDRRRYLRAHMQMRQVLGAYLDQSPDVLHFFAGPHGKPALSQRHSRGTAELRFNLSHSGDYAVLALSNGHEVGVDIEMLRPGIAEPGLAAQVLSPQELQVLSSVPPTVADTFFLNGWTRKEAVLKALGCGLSRELRDLTVGLDQQRRWLQLDLDQPAIEVVSFDFQPDCAAAVAMIGGVAGLEFRQGASCARGWPH